MFKQFKGLLSKYLGMHVRSTSAARCRFLYNYIRHGQGPGYHIALFWTLLLNHMLCCIRTNHASHPNYHQLLIEKCICLSCGLTSQATIFQSCRHYVHMSSFSQCLLILVTPGRDHCFLRIMQYCGKSMCLALGHNMTAPPGFDTITSRFGMRRSTTMPPRSP